MNPVVSAQNEASGEMQGIFARMRAQWRDIALVFAIVAAFGVAYLHLATRMYAVSATLAPSDAELNMLTGVSSMTGAGSFSLGRIGLGFGSSDPQFSAFLQQLTSSATARQLLADDRVKAAIYDTTWDPRTRSFHPPSGAFADAVQAVKAALGANGWHAPTAADMQRYLANNVVPKEIGISELYSVSYSNRDPAFARYFLSRVLAISDDYLKQQKLARASAYVRYLDRQLKSIGDVDQRQAMLRLRLQQENFIMAASVNLPFSADIDDPPIVPSRPVWPNTMIVGVIVLFFGGGLAAALGLYFRPYHSIRRRFGNRAVAGNAMRAAGPLSPTNAGG